jgi:alpha/beta hydrolase family protein
MARRTAVARRGAALIALLAGLSAAGAPAAAKLLKFEVLRVESPAFEGRVFGPAGTYDKIVARATVAVDPADRHNRGIVDLALAPRGASGLVEAVGEVEIVTPTDAAKANRALFYEAVNRGRKLALQLLDDAPAGNALAKAGDAGNGFLMERGFTVVWSGWQGDTPAGDGRLTFAPPVVPNVTGPSREEFVFDNTTNPVFAPLSYPAADLDPAKASLTVRERADDPRQTPPGLGFAYEGPSRISIRRPAGFDAGAIYEFIYPAKDPRVMGLGFAAVRDVVSFLRRDKADAGGAPNPLARVAFERAIGFGISQSGRFMRDFLYQGFNEDEAGRVVFEGVMPHIAGGKKTFVNYRFAQPGRHSQQHAETTYPGDQFPFTYPVLTDDRTGRTDGLLAGCLAAGNCPKVMQTDTGLELYQSRASLVVTDTKGEAIELPPNVRVYLMSNVPHFSPAGAKPAIRPACEQPTNPLHAGAPMRALVAAMDEWLATGAPPPDSRYPSRKDGTLVPREADAVGFPAIPGFPYTGLVNRATVVDHSVMPPVRGAAYPVFVGRTDEDGHDLAGIRLPTLEAPTATYISWNYRKEGFARGELCDLTGSTLPLAATAEERAARHDPRRSLAERYPGAADYAARVEAAARRLVAERLMLDEDAQRFVEAAKSAPQRAAR